jgi:hypothetical protein
MLIYLPNIANNRPIPDGCQVVSDITWQQQLGSVANFFPPPLGKRRAGKGGTSESKTGGGTHGRAESRAEVTTYSWWICLAQSHRPIVPFCAEYYPYSLYI